MESKVASWKSDSEELGNSTAVAAIRSAGSIKRIIPYIPKLKGTGTHSLHIAIGRAKGVTLPIITRKKRLIWQYLSNFLVCKN